MFHHMTFGDAVLSGGYGKEIQLGLDSLARLSMHEGHRCRRIYRQCVSWTSVSWASLYCSECRLCGRSFYTFTRGSPNTAHHGVGDASFGSRFYVLA